MKLPKPTRHVDEAYLAFVRTRPCAVCPRQTGVDPHHLVTRATGGGDHQTVSLCRIHHRELHSIGRQRFEKNYAVELWSIAHGMLSLWVRSVGNCKGKE